jgi:hypothetical protein
MQQQTDELRRLQLAAAPVSWSAANQVVTIAYIAVVTEDNKPD